MKYFFHPVWQGGNRPLTIEECEALLSEHFGNECIVTGSGRSALDLVLRQAGLNRYQSRVALTPMISRCVFDVTVSHAFPVDPSRDKCCDLVLRYHQMGIPQIEEEYDVPVIEDICHAFFIDLDSTIPKSGKGWAVFSLPKFFPIAGMAGGIVVQDSQEAQALRELRDHSPPLTDAEQQSQEEIFQRAYWGDPQYSNSLEILYLKRRLNSRCHPRDLAGFPTSAHALEALCAARRGIMQRFLESFDSDMFPPFWHTQLSSWLPFALPVFLNSKEKMKEAVIELNSFGIQSNLYSIDVSRNQAQPNLQQAIVVPCHHQLNNAVFDMIISSLAG